MTKFKVSELPWYYKLGSSDESTWWFGSWAEESEKAEHEGDRYDGPYRYLQPCTTPPTLPRREGVLLWIRQGRGYYLGHCFQENSWFETVEAEQGEYEFEPCHVKQRILDEVMHASRRLLKPVYQRLQEYWRVKASTAKVHQDVARHMRKASREDRAPGG